MENKKNQFQFHGETVVLPEIKGKKDVFISYKRKNVSFASRVFNELIKEEYGIKVWFDINELHENVGDEYANRIHEGIDNSEYFMLIYTKEVEDSDFIINEELKYAINKGKKVLFYPMDPIDCKTSRVSPFIEKIQWLDTKDTVTYQNDTQDHIHDELKKAQLTALTNMDHGFTAFDDLNVLLIRIAIQKKLGQITPFGNYHKLCGTENNEVFDNNSMRLRVINKSLFVDVPKKYVKELEELNFFRKDNKKIQEIDRHLKEVRPDNEELMRRLVSFIEDRKDIYSMEKVLQWFTNHLCENKYSGIKIPSLESFDIKQFLMVVSEMVACTFIDDIRNHKTMFNGAELGVYDIIDNRTINSENHYVDVQLYYSDYFTFKCMTELYHILCSIDDRAFMVENVAHIKPLAPFLCSFGLGGFVSVYADGEVNLMWAKRADNISSGDMWHFSYDETVSLLNDAAKDSKEQILVSTDGSVRLDIDNILIRALREEIGAESKLVEEDNHGVFEIGIIKSERLEVELLSFANLHLPAEPSLSQQIKSMHDVASDGYMEISKIDFLPLNDNKSLVGRLLTPESYQASLRLKERLRPNVGKSIFIGTGTIIEEGSTVGDKARIGNNCKIHRNVHIGEGVVIGNNVKIQNNNSIYEGVHLADGVFVGTNVCFTNDRYPRSIRRQDGLPARKGDWKLEETFVEYGASIGSGAVIRCGVTIGEWAMVGCGAVVIDDVPSGAIVVGNPARIVKTDIEY